MNFFEEAEIIEALFGKIETVEHERLNMLYEYAIVADKKVPDDAEKYLTVAAKKIKLTSKIRTFVRKVSLHIPFRIHCV